MTPQDAATYMVLLTTGLGAYATNILVSMLTMAFPQRPTWVAPGAALICGIGCSLLQTLAFSESGLTQQAIPQAVLGGIIIAGAAVGLHSAGRSAEAKRAKALARPATRRRRNGD